MPRGALPKVYDQPLVDRVAALYARGLTQAEIAREVGRSQKVVWNVMRRHGIAARVAAKRNQSGPANHKWKGDSASYSAFHFRVEAARGKPSKCEDCGTTTAKRFEWANLTGRYEDVNDYKRLCCSCHHKLDGHVRNLGAHAQRKQAHAC